jgi:hypothetical protein
MVSEDSTMKHLHQGLIAVTDCGKGEREMTRELHVIATLYVVVPRIATL